RHTTSTRDWSSDVCSSDLGVTVLQGEAARTKLLHRLIDDPPQLGRRAPVVVVSRKRDGFRPAIPSLQLERTCAGAFVEQRRHVEIGRASCRERMEIKGDTV